MKVLDSCCEGCTPQKTCDKIKVSSSRLTMNGKSWNTDYNNKILNYAKLILADGTAVWFRGVQKPSVYNCDNDNLADLGYGNICGLFWVDVNGLDKTPNQLGRDIFSFILRRKGLMPNDVNKDCY